MQISFFGIDRQYKRYRDDFIKITDNVLSSGKVLQGPEVQEMEETLCGMCSRKHSVVLGSGTDALAFALLSAGIGPGDEVLVTSFSFFASVSPILRVGAVPGFIDIESEYYNMVTSLLDSLVTGKTKAMIAVHLFGQTLPMNVIEDFADRHNLVLIEDAAQSLGSSDGDRPAGSMGKISCLSFDPTKVIGSFSSAGALLTDDDEIFRKVRSMRYHGKNPETKRYEMLGYNCQLSCEMAAMLSFKLAKINEWRKERETIADIYLEHLSEIDEITLPVIRPGSGHNWHKFVIRADDRDNLFRFLKERGIITMIHYPVALCDEPLVKKLQLPLESVNAPATRKIVSSVLSLPIFPELTEAEAKYVVESIKDFYDTRK